MWFFVSPFIIFGPDALEFLGNIKGDRCFIVTDKNLEELGYLKILTDKLDQIERKYEIYNEVKPNPQEEDVLKGKERCITYAPNLIIALGGGSVIDTAKAIWAMYEFPEFVLDDLNVVNEKLYDIGKKSTMVAIPTTSGTGAETTWAMVLSRHEQDVWRKIGFSHKKLVPTYAILDPIFPTGMPKKLTVYTAFDTLAHSFETVASDWRNEFSDALALKAIELVFKYLPIVVKDEKNKEARDYLHQAATLAGLAFGNGQVHLGHAMGHSWGAVFHSHHGATVGIFLRYVTQYCMNDSEKDDTIKINAKLAKQLGWAKWDDDDKKAADAVIDKIKELQEKVDMPLSLKELGVSREDFDKNLDKMVSLSFQDSSNVMASRSPLTEDYKKIYTYAYEGKDIDF